ncbi:MAG: hypothetical protein H6Q72_4912 [Firmicutes bacterium]|nr:hypothetical protein [Bacillota bacterium]
MAKKISGYIVWPPRILSLLFIITIALMSMDVIRPELSPLQILAGLLMHNIPTIVMIVVLSIAWKHEIVGGLAFLLAGLLYIFMTARAKIDWSVALSWNLTIAAPALLIGILYLISWYKKRQK